MARMVGSHRYRDAPSQLVLASGGRGNDHKEKPSN